MIPTAISDYLDHNHARYSLIAHPTAYTAQEEAAAAHIPGSEWAKTVVLFADDEPILAVLPAQYSVDLNRLQESAHLKSVRLAKENEFASLYRDCELGAVPPLGPLFHQRVFVDTHLTRDPEVAFNAGSHHYAVRMPYREFERIVLPTVADFASGPKAAAGTTKIDPICGAALSADLVTYKSEHRGVTYFFCSMGCKMEFDDNPNAYGLE